MKKSISALALVAVSLMASAESRTAQEALKAAQQFVAATPALHNSGIVSLSLSSEGEANARMRANNSSESPYYIVNIADNAGYVIVSGDDRFKTVLGYSDTGHIGSEEDMPEALRYWLGSLAGEMDHAVKNGYEAKSRIAANSYDESVEPLLTCTWDQGSPYNKLIPNYATGCVATGIAQVMYYWKYPEHGIGSHTNGNNTSYSADFAAATYDWANMKDSYGGKYDTSAQIDAVATLMLHLGIATDMVWRSPQEGSATGNIFAAYALVNFFGYNKNLHAEDRDFYSLGAWKALLIDQLRAGRPVPYNGLCDAAHTAGHFFVIDGYDAETGLFHVNWGWSGKCNGYYDITALEPGTGGIGAGMGSYKYFQQAYIDVQPEETGEYVAHFDSDDIKPAKMQTNKDNVSISTYALRHNSINFSGCFGMAVYTSDGTLHKIVRSSTDLPAGFYPGSNYSGEFTFDFNLSSVEDGDYTVCLTAMHDSYPGKVYPVRGFYGKNTYYRMTVSGNNVAFAEQTANCIMSDTNAPVIVNALAANTVYQNVVSTFSITVRNSGTTEFCDEVGVCVKKSRDANPQYITVPCTLLPGEEKTITLKGKVMREPGNYNLVTCYGDNGEYVILDNSVAVTVGDEASGIETVETENADSPVYSLTGVRVSSMSKGIYIKNGKKIIK